MYLYSFLILFNFVNPDLSTAAAVFYSYIQLPTIYQVLKTESLSKLIVFSQVSKYKNSVNHLPTEPVSLFAMKQLTIQLNFSSLSSLLYFSKHLILISPPFCLHCHVTQTCPIACCLIYKWFKVIHLWSWFTILVHCNQAVFAVIEQFGMLYFILALSVLFIIFPTLFCLLIEHRISENWISISDHNCM